MRFPRAHLIFASLAAALGGTSAARAEFSLFNTGWGSVIVATDATEEGKKLPLASKEAPVYYKGLSMGNKLGEGLHGDEEPTVKELNAVAASILAKQGYLPARPGKNEPTLLLVLQWGYMDPRSEDLLWFLGYRTANDIAAPAGFGLGPEVYRRGMRSPAIETIIQDAQDPIYGIMISAFEYKSAKTLQPVILWQTRIGLPANGKSMLQALPVMMASAGPVIGRPSDKAVLLDSDAARNGSVNLGELKFIDSFEDPMRGKGIGSKP